MNRVNSRNDSGHDDSTVNIAVVITVIKEFAVSGPVVWNSLPVALRSTDVTEETFRTHLKTFLFNCLDNQLCR